MSDVPFLSTAEVADQKGCTQMAVRNAIARGDLAAIRLGRTWAVANDERLAEWIVKETGGRTHLRGTNNRKVDE